MAAVGSELGRSMYALIERLYPLCRSITGEGVRQTLAEISRHVPLEVNAVASGEQVFDWQIPREWNIHSAWIKNSAGETIVDFAKCNLHVVSYSTSVHKTLSLGELKQHLYTLPQLPTAIPYRTSYYKETWGFCMSHQQYTELLEDEYEVYIDSSLSDGVLNYAEYFIPGETDDEILLSTHICHPSLANDNLSGISLLTYLAQHLEARANKNYSYRLLFVPGTIGSIAWLARNQEKTKNIKHGLVLSCVGDDGGPIYKRSRRGDALVDRAVAHVFEHHIGKGVVKDFYPYGYDERQFCSPGFNLPVGLFERSQYGEFPQYHNSLDNLDFVTPAALQESFDIVLQIIDIIENDVRYQSLNPYCEPQLGKRGLYDAIGGDNDQKAMQMALLWVMNQADGQHSLLDIAAKAKQPFHVVHKAACLLENAKLLRRLVAQ